ncbi:L,D-transpeptidase [Commensalibacter oyaizuii]|uniref:L,D-transpeptidase n=1 Tax=Commensalibacter oyaizuii TaxID=3043873 RepID=A0ABT6Q1U6_9PROT|nr:L,D-transpeptidase [Commensalibacter sp. TBRC 16381]MDI2091058.1 L,D-transpeptidase [Commensalibacter sp. TBRC 16381]
MKCALFTIRVLSTVVILAPAYVNAVPASFNVQDDISSIAQSDVDLPRSLVPSDRTDINQTHINFNDYVNTSLFQKGDGLHNLPPLPSLDREEAYQEAKKLVVSLKKAVPNAIIYTPKQNQEWIRLAKNEMERSGPPLQRAQILTVIDRNPKVQALCFVLAFPKGQGEWIALGGGRVSTGNTGRKLYYITPTGVFINTTERIGYRALGTKNKNGIRGNGIKGMRVWDFGWQWAQKGWLPNREIGQIRLEMHATDPDYLEQRLGHPASEGCVRISTAMNRFIDRYGLMDALYNQAAQKDKRFRAILSKDHQFSPIAGDALVIVDSSLTKDSQQT